MNGLTSIHCKNIIRKHLAGQEKLLSALENTESCTTKSCRSFLDRLCEGVVKGRDYECFESMDELVKNLSFGSVLIAKEDYLKATVHALNLAPKIAGTDYGTTRQRDLAQIWTDAIRGFLGEIAFVKWLKTNFKIEAELDFRRGPLREFLTSDLAKVRERNEAWREPRLKVSVKTTKLQGIWLDIPYAQLEHSDIFVLVRVGVSRSHFVAFLKEISVIRDKIFKTAKEWGVQINESDLWDALPDFTEIPAFIVGFFDKREHLEVTKDRTAIVLADGKISPRKKGGLKITLNKFMGWWNPSDPIWKRRIVEKISTGKTPSHSVGRIEIELEGIGTPSETIHFFISSGALKRKREEWETILAKL